MSSRGEEDHHPLHLPRTPATPPFGVGWEQTHQHCLRPRGSKLPSPLLPHWGLRWGRRGPPALECSTACTNPLRGHPPSLGPTIDGITIPHQPRATKHPLHLPLFLRVDPLDHLLHPLPVVDRCFTGIFDEPPRTRAAQSPPAQPCLSSRRSP